jgi:hypothetical protein
MAAQSEKFTLLSEKAGGRSSGRLRHTPPGKAVSGGNVSPE